MGIRVKHDVPFTVSGPIAYGIGQGMRADELRKEAIAQAQADANRNFQLALEKMKEQGRRKQAELEGGIRKDLTKQQAELEKERDKRLAEAEKEKIKLRGKRDEELQKLKAENELKRIEEQRKSDIEKKKQLIDEQRKAEKWGRYKNKEIVVPPVFQRKIDALQAKKLKVMESDWTPEEKRAQLEKLDQEIIDVVATAPEEPNPEKINTPEKWAEKCATQVEVVQQKAPEGFIVADPKFDKNGNLIGYKILDTREKKGAAADKEATAAKKEFKTERDYFTRKIETRKRRIDTYEKEIRKLEEETRKARAAERHIAKKGNEEFVGEAKRKEDLLSRQTEELRKRIADAQRENAKDRDYLERKRAELMAKLNATGDPEDKKKLDDVEDTIREVDEAERELRGKKKELEEGKDLGLPWDKFVPPPPLGVKSKTRKKNLSDSYIGNILDSI